jgi:predicted phosphatase
MPIHKFQGMKLNWNCNRIFHFVVITVFPVKMAFLCMGGVLKNKNKKINGRFLNLKPLNIYYFIP